MTKTKRSGKRHQVQILTSHPGKTWASCATCGSTSKQGHKAAAEAWQVKHVDDTMPTAQAGRR